MNFKNIERLKNLVITVLIWGCMAGGLLWYNTYIYSGVPKNAQDIIHIRSLLAFRTGFNNIMLHFILYPVICTLMLMKYVPRKNQESIIRKGRNEVVTEHYIIGFKVALVFSLIFSIVLYFGFLSHCSSELIENMEIIKVIAIYGVSLFVTYGLYTSIYICIYLTIYNKFLSWIISSSVYMSFWFFLRVFKINFVYRNASLLTNIYKGNFSLKTYGNAIGLQLGIIILLVFVGNYIYKRKDIII